MTPVASPTNSTSSSDPLDTTLSPGTSEPDLLPLRGDLLTTSLDRVLEHYNITDWDILMIGDGSGYSWNIGCGWSGVIIDRFSMGRKLLWGAWSTGTIMIAEIMPYIHGLAWFDNLHAKDRRRQMRKAILNIHVISDNKTIVDQGNHDVGRDKMLPWWSCWANYMRSGYVAKFHHVLGHEEGQQIGLQVLGDHVSRYARVLLQRLTLNEMVPDLPDMTVYDVNPL